MKQVLSRVFFVLMVAVFIFDMLFTAFGVMDVKRELDRLAATPGASGIDYWGVGIDILIIEVILISLCGTILAVVSWKMAEDHRTGIISIIMYALFILMIFLCFLYIYI